MRGVANLTQILDNWRFDILGQMQSMMQNDMQGLLPDYTRSVVWIRAKKQGLILLLKMHL